MMNEGFKDIIFLILILFVIPSAITYVIKKLESFINKQRVSHSRDDDINPLKDVLEENARQREEMQNKMRNQQEENIRKVQEEDRIANEEKIRQEKIRENILIEKAKNKIIEKNETIKLSPEQEKLFSAYFFSTKKTLEEREIKYLVHFTRATNLPSILEHGLLPISAQKRKGIKSSFNDGKSTLTSLSIEFPNYLMLDAKSYNISKGNYAILLIDANILLDKEFFYENINHINDKLFLSFNVENAKRGSSVKVNSLEKMFPEKLVSNKTSKLINRSELNIPACYTTSPQAEICVSATIPSSFIRRICFESEYEKLLFMKYIDEDDYDIIFEENSFYFSHRCDSNIWSSKGGYF